MLPKRLDPNEGPREVQTNADFPLHAEMVRPKGEATAEKPNDSHGEEKITLFWRLFGGTFFSIIALLVITGYNSINGSLVEVRGDLNRLRDSKSDFIKKDEYTSTKTTLWNRVQEVQKELQTTQALVPPLRDRMTVLEEFRKTCDADRKELQTVSAMVGAIKDKVTSHDAAIKQFETLKKELQILAGNLSNLQERGIIRDQQVMAIQESRKENLANQDQLFKHIDAELKATKAELQALRERLAKLEGANEGKTAAKAPAVGKVTSQETTPTD